MMRACIEVQRVQDLWVYSIPRHNKFIQRFETRLQEQLLKFKSQKHDSLVQEWDELKGLVKGKGADEKNLLGLLSKSPNDVNRTLEKE